MFTGEGETGADDSPPENLECTPEIEEGVVWVCNGTGVGGATLDIQGGSPIFKCVTDPSQGNQTDCAANPLDLEDLYEQSGDQLVHPAACCEEEPVDVDAPLLGCVTDCAHAACKWAALELRAVAATLQGDPEGCDDPQCFLKADLLLRAHQLETSKFQECVDKIVKFRGQVITWSLGGTDVDENGSLDNLTLLLGCAIDSATRYSPPDACSEAAHAVPPPNMEADPMFSAVAFAGVYGSGSTPVLDVDYTTYAPACGSPPCFFELSEFDLELDDVAVGDYLFERITLSLDEIAEGTRTGTSVTIPEGNLVFNLSAVVSVDGEYLYGSDPYVFGFVNTEDVEATYFSGVFNVQSAVFDYGEAIAVLNTDLPVF